MSKLWTEIAPPSLVGLQTGLLPPSMFSALLLGHRRPSVTECNDGLVSETTAEQFLPVNFAPASFSGANNEPYSNWKPGICEIRSKGQVTSTVIFQVMLSPWANIPSSTPRLVMTTSALCALSLFLLAVS
jgi:hypothetical protein